MSPETPNILFAVIAIMAGAITYFALKTWFWKQEAMFNFQMWKNEEKHNGELFSQLCQMAERVRYDGEKKPAKIAYCRQEDVDAVMAEYPEVAASDQDILILHNTKTKE